MVFHHNWEREHERTCNFARLKIYSAGKSLALGNSKRNSRDIRLEFSQRDETIECCRA